MAQKKLLFALILSSLINGPCHADEDFEADNIINNLNKMPIAKITAGGSEKVENNNLGENPYLLRVFVSNSMPRPLLKAYSIEARKYNGALVFKGLPDGSFKAMSELVQYLSADLDQEENFAIQIDDEVFDKFGVTAVPTFVLSQERECTEAIGCQNSYDKISGNIGIKAALEKFAQSGELKEASAKILQEAEKQ
jgi:type-F conjugative transfer system pilin assembly protein TrbC